MHRKLTPTVAAVAPDNSSSPGADGSGTMFDAIASRYDRLNRVMSLGTDRLWRRRTVEALELRAGARVLDLATGTADLAAEIARAHPECRVVGTDPSTGMLAVGRDKLERGGLAERVTLHTGTATELAFEDDTFDAVTIAFGIRNVPDREAAVAEMARVTRPGGRIAVLELSEPRGGLLGPLARFHIRQVVPRVGALLSGEREYRYLQQSIAEFPSPDAFAATLQRCGIDVLSVRPLTFGVCVLFVGTPAEGAA